MAEPLFRVKDLTKIYTKGSQQIEVLKNLSLVVEEGQAIGVVGASGAGKSTLLHMLGTLDRPDSGEIYFRGEDITAWSDAQLAAFRNEHLGFVFQFHHLLNEFTALENVMMPALIRRKKDAEARERATEMLIEVGLKDRMEHHPTEMSGGEQQRVALARALVLDPPLLLADEATGNLDERTGEEIHDLLFELNQKRGVTMMVVTHNPRLADRMPHQWRLSSGRIEALS